MQLADQRRIISWKEVVFQICLHLLIFVFFSFEEDQPYFQASKIALFTNYAIAALVINYFLLPRFYYRNKYVIFFLGAFFAVLIAMAIEELVLEPIYFPKRASSFPGMIFTLSQILPVITILCGVKFAWDALGKQKEVEELQSEIKESELQFLKSQINPHFLFNNLNNLYSYAIEKSPRTPEIILELSGVLRYMLYECKEKYVPLKKEVEQLENFIKLSKLQIEERGQVNFIKPDHTYEYQIAPLILTVFVENAFKHSTASQSKDIFINIEVEITHQGVLKFKCDNSYRTQSNTDSLSKGIGLENVKKRLQLLYPDSHKLAISNDEKTFSVRLSIDLNKTNLA